LCATIEVAEPLMDLTLTRDGRFLVSGGFGRQLVIRLAHNLRTVHEYKPLATSIRSLCLAPDEQTIWLGMVSGDLVACDINFARWRRFCQE